MRAHLFLCIAIASSASLVACSDDDDASNPGNGSAGAAASDKAIAQGDQQGQALDAMAQDELQGGADTDAIAKSADVLNTINDGELAQATFVLSKTSNADVRDLANQIIDDHTANNTKLDDLLNSHTLEPLSNQVSLQLKAEGDAGLAKLMADAPADLDRDYVTLQVTMHQEAFVIIGTLDDFVDASDMSDFLAASRDDIADHRDHASDVLDSL